MYHIGQQPLIFPFPNVHFINTVYPSGQHSKHKDNHALPADKSEQMPPHVHAIGEVIHILYQC